MDTLKKLAEIVVDYKGEDVAVTEATTFEDLGFDSLDKVDLMMQVEEAFDIQFAEDFSTENVGGLVTEINKLKK